MVTRHCRYCKARLADDKDWLDNYCSEEHRVRFQDEQHQKTIERLRQQEFQGAGDEHDSELAVHGFEPRRVRVSMLGGAAPGDRDAFAMPTSGPDYSRAGTGRPMPPQVHVQPLVAPRLQPKAPVEQSLAALSYIAEPLSRPIEIPLGYTSEPAKLGAVADTPAPPKNALGASVRRPARQPAEKAEAIVNLIRGARERMGQEAAQAVGPAAVAETAAAPAAKSAAASPSSAGNAAPAKNVSKPEPTRAALPSAGRAQTTPTRPLPARAALPNRPRTEDLARPQVARPKPQPSEPSPDQEQPTNHNSAALPSFLASHAHLNTANWRRMLLPGAVGAAMLGGLVVFALSGGSAQSGKHSTMAAASFAPANSEDWITRMAKGGKEFSIYQPSIKSEDYRAVFEGQIQHKALNWVFRWKDSSNYYVARLTERAGARASFERWKVEKGQPTAPVAVPVTLGENGLNRVRVEAAGTHFSTYLNGRKVDDFNDSSFTTGAFGFLNDTQEVGLHGVLDFKASR